MVGMYFIKSHIGILHRKYYLKIQIIQNGCLSAVEFLIILIFFFAFYVLQALTLWILQKVFWVYPGCDLFSWKDVMMLPQVLWEIFSSSELAIFLSSRWAFFV